MLYGLDHNVLNSPFSLIISILLSIGVVNIGYQIQKFAAKKLISIEFKKNFLYFSPIVGTYTLIFLLYLVLIFELNFFLIIKIVSILLVFFGLLPFFFYKKLFKFLKDFNFQSQNIHFYLILFIYFLLFLISASPITHADSLDYHFSGALNLLNNGSFNKELLPMNYNIVSIGEIIIAIGLILKAEQFGGIVQFLSLLCLIPLFTNTKSNYSFLILILICPITFFLTSSPKPQLLFSISTLIIFIFLYEKVDYLKTRQLKIIFPIVILVLAINSITKYSFLLSSILIGLYFLSIMIKKKLFVYSIFSIAFIFCITFLPSWLFRYEYFVTHFFDLVRSPFPLNIYGYETQHALLSGGSLSILGIFFPTSLKTFSTSYGPLLILLPLMLDKKILKSKLPILILLLFIILVFIFGSNLPRFLFEGYLWLIYLVSKNLKINSLYFKVFSKLIYLQLVFIIGIYIFYVLNFFPGSLNQKFKERIMTNNANGYQLAKWANEILDKNDVLLSTHRSISLFNNKTFSFQFTWNIDNKDTRSKIYYDYLKSKKVNKIIFYGDRLETNIFTKCLGKQLAYKHNVGRHVGRNPFNRGDYYNGWIFEFNHSYLPNCLSR